MSTFTRALAAVAVAELLAGAAGAAVHRDGSPAADGPPATLTPTTTATLPATGSAPGAATTVPPSHPGLSSSFIQANLVNPTDMGGYYRVDSQGAGTFLTSAPCLASLLPSTAQSGHASEALLGPDRFAVPTVYEMVASYPSGAIGPVYKDVVSSISACKNLAFEFGGDKVSAALSADDIAPVADADQAWSGKFDYQGASMSIQLGVVETGQTLVSVVWIDTEPASDAIMGNFPSTLSLAIGKLA